METSPAFCISMLPQKFCVHHEFSSPVKLDLTTFQKLSNLTRSPPKPLFWRMALTRHYYTKFEAGCFYHVYNRSVDRKPMFRSDANYEYFLHRYDHYISGYAETYAYSLMNNHFHLLIRVKDLTDLTTFESCQIYPICQRTMP